jgi:hypothetical protein
MTKLTKKDYFKMVASVIENSNVENKAELQSFISHEIELLDKKAQAKSTAETAKQKENNELIEVIYEVLAGNGNAMTITEVQAENSKLAELSNQRMSALLKKLLDADRIVRTELKKKAYFKVK